MRNYQELHKIMVDRVNDTTNERNNRTNTGQITQNEFDYSYLSFNSLYKNQNFQQQNRLDFLIIQKGESLISKVGASIFPTQIVQLQISPLNLGRKFTESGNTIQELQFGKLFINIPQFQQQSFSSHDGFRFHFAFNVEENPNDLTQLIAIPVNDFYSFSNPVRFDGNLSFEFFTNKPYNFEQDTYECYVDYTPLFMTIYKVDGTPHNLSNLDIIFLDNFDVPGLVQLNNSFASTHKSKMYRVSVIDLFRFEIQLELSAQIKNSINRPADPSLGIYRPPITVNVSMQNPTLITSPIPHGLQNNNQIQITSVSRNDINFLIGTWSVIVVNSTQFTINADTSMLVGSGQAVISSFPISTQRTNTLFVKIVTKKVEFTLMAKSKSENAQNSLINIMQ